MPTEERLRDYDDRDEIDERLARIVSRVVNGMDVGVRYSEGNGEKRMLSVLVALTTTLIGAFIIGGIVLYGKVSAIEANQVNQQRQLDQLSSTVASIRRAP